jgi:hypothetical protein
METAPASVTNAVSHVSASALAEAGSTITESGPYTSAFTVLEGQPRLTNDGKPLIAFVGSNYCPYCAATRWPLVVALSRFGTFKGLRMTASSLTDEDPGTKTLSFYGSTYTSPYIAFSPTELCTDVPSSSTSTAVEECKGYEPLQSMSATADEIFFKYDFPPYVSSSDEGTIPFADFANKFIEDGAFMNPSILTGFTQVQIAHGLANPAASPAQTILIASNYYAAAICTLTNNQPDSVCEMRVVKQAAAALKL